MKNDKGRKGCYRLKSINLMGCANVSVEAVTNLVKTLPDITYVGSDKITHLYKQLISTIDDCSRKYQIENFEHTVSDSDYDNDDDDDTDSDEVFMSKIAAHCPNIKTVKLNINQV